MILVGFGVVGSDDGVGIVVMFLFLVGFVIGINGVFYVVDDGNNLICMVILVGVVVILVGFINVGSIDGFGSIVMFN